MRNSRFVLIAILAPAIALAGGAGFGSKYLMDDQFLKHGREFGNITEPQYLLLAQQLRDARASGNVLMSGRPDGVFLRFDRKHRFFGSYNADKTVRAFFIPPDGVRYFERQARRFAPE